MLLTTKIIDHGVVIEKVEYDVDISVTVDKVIGAYTENIFDYSKALVARAGKKEASLKVSTDFDKYTLPVLTKEDKKQLTNGKAFEMRKTPLNNPRTVIPSDELSITVQYKEISKPLKKTYKITQHLTVTHVTNFIMDDALGFRRAFYSIIGESY